MTSTQIRQSFLNFFKSKQHTIVPSSSLMPDSPNLLFTNAGMNQFVPIFLGQTKCPYTPGRAADTQKCIRAGGKHNDLDDVGLDTYHHTFFEMLGNWSFGDYFKPEAIDWAWELVVKVWNFPPQRLYATVFCPYLGEPGWEQKWAVELEQVLVLAMTSSTYIPPNANASPFEIADQEAAMFWVKKFQGAGCDPKVHIIPGNKKDNFWMMGETGPCGPCTEIHVDLTPDGNTRGSLVNKGDARCIEIWNNVFIQFNANPDGTFAPLPAKHVDTGMGFERVTSIIQGTKGLTDFKHAKISNYETDIFRPIFDAIEKLSGKRYGSTLPKPGSTGDTEQEKADVAFRVIADHIRTLSFAIADGIQPGIKGRNGVLRSIHKRMLRYASTIDVQGELLLKTQDALIDTLAETMGDVFPELRANAKHIKEVLRQEADVFNRTLDGGLDVFNRVLSRRKELQSESTKIENLVAKIRKGFDSIPSQQGALKEFIASTAADFSLLIGETTDLSHQDFARFFGKEVLDLQGASRRLARTSPTVSELMLGDDALARKNFKELLDQLSSTLNTLNNQAAQFPGRAAFTLHDTYGFPLDLTELMARERGLSVDKEGFNKLMEEQKKRSQAAQVKEVIELSKVNINQPTNFVGYDALSVKATTVGIVGVKEKERLLRSVAVTATPFYAEMGGQVGDTGTIRLGDKVWRVVNTVKAGRAFCHVLAEDAQDELNEIPREVELIVDQSRRAAIQRHHTVTHLLHWALHEVASKEASQKGSFVGPDKLTFDFNSAPLTPAQVADIEKLVNERILENAGVSWTEVLHNDVKGRKDVMQFFGEKYGDTVRVVQIGGEAGQLNGYSMELCGGTHTRATGEIGLFRIVGESAIAAGVRRIEAVAGLEAYKLANDQLRLLRSVAGHLNSPVAELEKKVESLLAQQKALEKEVQIAMQRNASNAASELLPSAQTVNGIPLITHNLGDATGDFLQAIADALKGRFKGVVVLGGGSAGSVTLIATVSAEYTARVQAGKIIQAIAPIVGGKGGGKPDNARGGGKDASKLDEALAKAKSLLG